MVFQIGNNVGEMSLEHPGNGNHRLEARMGRPEVPFLEEGHG